MSNTYPPHLYVERQGKLISTLDLFGTKFVLLGGSEGGSWIGAAKQVSAALGIEIDVFCIGPDAELVSKNGIWEAAAGIAPNGAVL